MATLHIRNVPDGVHDALKARAARERRSLNAQVVELLEQALASDALRQQRLEALEEIARIRDSAKPVPGGIDTLAMLREDRAR